MVTAAELEAAHAAAASNAAAAAGAPGSSLPVADPFPSLPVADPFPSLGGRSSVGAIGRPAAAAAAAAASQGPSASSVTSGGTTKPQQNGTPVTKTAMPVAPGADDFPALGGPVRAPVWTGTAPVIHRTKHTTTLVLPSTPALAAKTPAVLSRIRAKYGGPTHSANTGLGAHANAVTIDASSTQKMGITTFILRSASEKSLLAAKKELSTSLAQRVTLAVPIPAGLRAHVIGAKGKTLRSILDATGVKIDIPKASQEGAAQTQDEDDWANAEQIDITIDGDEINARAARDQILALVAERTSKITQRLPDIDRVYFPFIAGPKNSSTAVLESDPELGAGQVKVRIPPPAAFLPNKDGTPAAERDLSIIVSGERDAVQRVVAHIQAKVLEMKRSYKTLALQLPKRQHRFLVGENAADVLVQTGCSIEVAPASDKSDVVTLRGPAASLPVGLSATIARANSVAVESVDLAAAPGDAKHAQTLVRWLRNGHAPHAEGVQVYWPRENSTEVEITGPDAEAVASVRSQIEKLVQSHPPSVVGSVSIDPLVHRHLIGKKHANLQKYAQQNVHVLFPPLSENSAVEADDPVMSVVTLVYDAPEGRSAADAPAALASVQKQLETAAAAFADMETITLTVPAKLHPAILGPNGTTLNAIIGEEKVVAVSLGSTGQKSQNADQITIRGPSADAKRVSESIQSLAKEAEQDAIVNGFQATLQVEQAYVPHLIGKSGAAVSKLRDELGIKVDVDAPGADAAAKKRKVLVTLTGRRENVAEAERRLRAQIERLEDETTITLKIDPALHGALIGQRGKYVQRLQEKYGVRIDFPRSSAVDEATATDSDTGAEADAKLARKQKPDEVIVRGGKKGVASTKTELLELVAYEVENNNVATVTVPGDAVARILGRGGSNIAQLRDDSGAQIDLDFPREAEQGEAKIRGTKEAIARARKAIEQIVAQVEQEVTYTIEIPSAFHGQLIGPRGSGVRDLVLRVGGDENLASLYVNFPRRSDEQQDQVVIRAPPAIANQLKAELQKSAEQLQARASEVTHGVSVPVAQHRTLIGRGGSRLREFEAEHQVRIFFPGSKLYNSAPTPSNSDVLEGVPAEQVVKVRGAPQAVEAAKALLGKSASPSAASKSVSVPEALSRQVANIKFLRSLRSDLNITVDLPSSPSTPAASSSEVNGNDAPARIDDDEPSTDGNLTISKVDLGPQTTWVLHGKDEDALTRAEDKIQLAIDEAISTGSYVGTLVVPSSAVGLVVGRQGRTLKGLESETGAHITVSREGGVINLTGSEDSVREAAEQIQEIVERD